MNFESFVLAAATGDLTDEPAARPHADAVEFRMDLAADPLDQLAAYDGRLPILATNRAAWEGGEADGDGRLDALAEAVEFDAVDAVDIELASLRGEHGVDADEAVSVRDLARQCGASVVASVHDFEGTPDRESLRRLLDTAAAAGDVGKLAVTAETTGDALALLTATHEATTVGSTVATMAMGEAGRHTRAVAPVYGSKIGYAPVDPANATAPGQYDLETLSSLVAALE